MIKFYQLYYMSDIFCRKIKDFIAANGMLNSDERVIVGLSGGADSVALLSVLLDLGYNCVAAHCNFHLREDESLRDERFCENLCGRLEVDFLKIDFNVGDRCAQTGESAEMACRSLRYEWWRSLIKNGQGQLVAVGHHREDNVETFFLNLLRGSGLTGLKSMLPRTADVVRPLLAVTRLDITEYLKRKGLNFVTDSTNFSDEYRRNRLRNRVLPEIERSFPRAMATIANSINYLRDNYALYADYVDFLRKKYVNNDGVIDLSQLLSEERNASIVLFEILSDAGINMTQVENMLDSVRCQERVSGKYFQGRNICYLLDRGCLIPTEIGQKYDSIIVIDDILTSPYFTIRRMSQSDFETLRKSRQLNQEALYLDSCAMNGNPIFELRAWRNGDRMMPFGMKGSKLVSDVFSDAKYSLLQKSKARILTRNGVIIWVVELKPSNHFRVNKSTLEVIEVTYNQED